MQILHVRPFSSEGHTIERLHAYARDHEDGLKGKHHGIYLSDFRRVKHEKLKTVIRQPVAHVQKPPAE